MRGNIVGAAIEQLEIKHPFRDRVRTCVLNAIIDLIPAPSEKDEAPFRCPVHSSLIKLKLSCLPYVCCHHFGGCAKSAFKV